MRPSSASRVLLPGVLAALSCAGPATAAAGKGVERKQGVWIGRDEIRSLKQEGPAWDALAAFAAEPLGMPFIRDQDSDVDIHVLAKALVYARTEEERYREEVITAIQAAMGTEIGGDILALGRNLPGYVIAADLVEPPSVVKRAFRSWLKHLLDEELDGKTLRQVHESRPNNWGTHAGGARAVIARYLDDENELRRVAKVFRGWLGDRSTYDGFEYGDLSWQADPEKPVGINPSGATRDGHSIDGVLPDDQRRSGSFTWPPPHENYVYEALQGALLQAVVLERAGYDAWEWEDRALLRAFRWLEDEALFPAQGDDTWQPHLINRVYGSDLTAPLPSRPGKNVGWTDWTCPEETVSERTR